MNKQPKSKIVKSEIVQPSVAETKPEVKTTKENKYVEAIKKINTHYEELMKAQAEKDNQTSFLAQLAIPTNKQEDSLFIKNNLEKICALFKQAKVPHSFVLYHQAKAELIRSYKRYKVEYKISLKRAKDTNNYKRVLELKSDFKKVTKQNTYDLQLLNLKYFVYAIEFQTKVILLRNQFWKNKEIYKTRKVAIIKANRDRLNNLVNEFALANAGYKSRLASANDESITKQLINNHRLAEIAYKNKISDAKSLFQTELSDYENDYLNLIDEYQTTRKLMDDEYHLKPLPTSYVNDYQFAGDQAHKIYFAINSRLKFRFKIARLRLKNDNLFQPYNELLNKQKEAKLEFKTNLLRANNFINKVDLAQVKQDYRKTRKQFKHDLYCLNLMYYFKAMDYKNRYETLLENFENDRYDYQQQVARYQRQNALSKVASLNEHWQKMAASFETHKVALRWERYLSFLSPLRARYEQEIRKCKLFYKTHQNQKVAIVPCAVVTPKKEVVVAKADIKQPKKPKRYWRLLFLFGAIVAIAAIAVPVVLSETSKHDYKVDGSDWKGHEKGTLNYVLDKKNKTVSYEGDNSSYVAKDWEMPSYVYDGGTKYKVVSIEADPFDGVTLTPKGVTISNTLTLPDTLTNIGDYAFCYQKNAKGTLKIPKNVTSIGVMAFYYTSFSGDLFIPNSVTTVGAMAFGTCLSLDGNLRLSENLTKISDGAFTGSKFKGDLHIPDSVVSIGAVTFDGCTFATLTLSKNLNYLGSGAFKDFGATGELIIPESVRMIPKECFSRSRFTSLVIPSEVGYIGVEAFSYNTNLQNIDFYPQDNGKCVIEDIAFADCGRDATDCVANVKKNSHWDVSNLKLPTGLEYDWKVEESLN